jgi:hypothetical protein
VAEEPPKRKKRRPGGEQRRARRSDGDRDDRDLSGAQLALAARKQLSAITGMKAESVTSLKRADDGTWRVTVELLELSRVPSTDDMLGSYEAELDERGELLGYRRRGRYTRSQADDQRPHEG